MFALVLVLHLLRVELEQHLDLELQVAALHAQLHRLAQLQALMTSITAHQGRIQPEARPFVRYVRRGLVVPHP